MNEQPRPAPGNIPAAALVDRILGVTEALIAIVQRETALLQACEPMKIVDLQPEKTRLANEYAMDIKAIQLRPELIDRAPSERVARLKIEMTRLHSVLDLNGRALAASKSVSERILKSVADVLNDQRAPTVGYGRDANLSRQSASSRNAAIALDSRV
jgi:hypothetical protein